MSDDTTIEGRAIPAEDAPKTAGPAPLPPRGRNRRGLVVGAIAVPLALGAVGLSLARGDVSPLTPVAPTSIASFQPSGAIAATGQVAEIYGNKFIVQDATGRALVETGREGEGGTLVKKGDTVTVQGRFEDGFLHATRLTYADGRVLPLGPGGPPPGALGWAKDRIGLGPAPDIAGITAIVQGQGYTDVRIAGRGPRHLEVAAKGRDGREQLLHVGFDGVIREARAL